MTSEHPAATSRRMCQYPGCDQPAAPAAGPAGPRSTAKVAATPRLLHGVNAAV